jgi:DNA helicase II / ATP-dependent DNA helicase PcrA
MTRTLHNDAMLAGFGPAQTSTSVDNLAGLNTKQREAAEAINGPLVIRAGAGTGKTTTVTKRAGEIIRTGAARPDQILAVTFTRKAAAELRGRIAAIVGPDAARKMTIGNFHAVSGEILRRHAHLVGLPSSFTVLDDDGQREIIATIAIERGYITNKKDKAKVGAFLEQISSWKEEGWTPEDVARKGNPEDLVLDKIAYEAGFGTQALSLFGEYQDMLAARRWCDFADMILHTVHIFRTHEDVRLRESGRYTHIMVDEFQDTSPVQNAWVWLMAKDHRNLCVVGDTDQSIYEWRNARPEIMMGFEKQWPGARAITIDANYRSTQEILDLANAVVAPLRAKDGLDKSLQGFKHGKPPVDLFQSYTSAMDEADSIAREAERLIDGGHKASEIAVLCRSGMIMRHIERSLRDRRMPYIVAGAMKFTDREEVRDGLAYLTLAVNPMDFIAFERVASKPARGVGGQKVGAIRRTMISKRCSIADAVALVLEDMPKRAAARPALAQLETFLRQAAQRATGPENAGQVLEWILEESGYWYWRETHPKDPQKELRIENLGRLISEAQSYNTAVEFLESMTLHSSQDERWTETCVVLSTIHASKGLEFDTVFTPAMEVGIFPNARSEKTSYGADEERRLAHVAWTRARNSLYVSWAKFRPERTGMGEPSPYLAECGLLDGPQRSANLHTGPRRLRARLF